MNKKKVLIIVGIVLALCTIIICTYLVLDKSNKVVEEENKSNTSEKKKTKKEDKKEENETIVNDETNFEDQNIYVDKLVGDVDINNEIVQKLYSYLYGVQHYYPTCIAGNNYSSIKYRDVGLPFDLSGYIYKSNMTSSEIPDNIKVGMVLEYLRWNKNIKRVNSNSESCDTDGYIINVNLINKYAKIIFGENTVINYDLIQSSSSSYSREGLCDGNTKYAIEFNYYCGMSIGSPEINHRLIDVAVNNDSVVLYEKTLFHRGDYNEHDKYYLYDNYNEDNLILTFDNMEDYSKFRSSLYNDATWNEGNISDKASIYKYTFKYDEANKHYYFYSVEKVK